MPGDMDCAGNQERKAIVAAVTSSVSFSPVENIWADSRFPLSSLADNGSCISTITSHQHLVGLSNPEVHVLPTSCQVVVECDQSEMRSMPSSTRHDMAEFITPEAYSLPPSSAILDRSAVVHAMNPFAMQFECLGYPVSHSNLHVVHSKMHGPSSVSLSTGEGSSLSGNTLCMSHSNVSASSGNNVAHVVSSSSPCVSKASTSRLEFMQSFVNTLLPELKSIHCQSPPMSLKEKLSAVRLAANMSLAVSAGCNNTWSQALFQELASSSSSKLEVRRKHNARKPNILKGRIYASILRRSSLRAGSHAMHLASRSHACHLKGSNSSASFSRVRGCSSATRHLSAEPSSDVSASLSKGGFDTARCKEIPYVHRVRHGRRSGQSSYVRILRQSRSREKLASVKLPAEPCNEANKAYTPSISKEHIMSLGKLVPGGRNMDVPLLFQEAAHYILSLQMQVEALQSLFHFVSL